MFERTMFQFLFVFSSNSQSWYYLQKLKISFLSWTFDKTRYEEYASSHSGQVDREAAISDR